MPPSAALPDLRASFHALERIVEAYPEGVNAEIAGGVYLMSPRPRVSHSAAQGRLFSLLHGSMGRGRGGRTPDWLFLIEPEIRSEPAFSRLIPDVAGWRRSTTGWPPEEQNPVELAPEWVAEILSPSTEKDDRGVKREAYGRMGVAWLWLVDPVKKRIEVFENVRGRMTPGPVGRGTAPVSLPPFPRLKLSLGSLSI